MKDQFCAQCLHETGDGICRGHEPADPLPCPLCGEASDIGRSLWSMEMGEVDAFECNSCFCGAPADAWNSRSSSNA